jgi:hypothetical protein
MCPLVCLSPQIGPDSVIVGSEASLIRESDSSAGRASNADMGNTEVGGMAELLAAFADFAVLTEDAVHGSIEQW